MDDESPSVEIPIDESPPVYRRAETRFFGLTPPLLAASLAAAAIGGGIALLAVGEVAGGLLLLAAAAFLATLFAEQARHRRESRLDRAAALTLDRSLALAGLARASIGAWSRAGRRAAMLRFDERALALERLELQQELGAAAYDEDEARIGDLRRRMHELDLRIEARRREAEVALEQARRRTNQERRAVASTQIRPPG